MCECVRANEWVRVCARWIAYAERKCMSETNILYQCVDVRFRFERKRGEDAVRRELLYALNWEIAYSNMVALLKTKLLNSIMNFNSIFDAQQRRSTENLPFPIFLIGNFVSEPRQNQGTKCIRSETALTFGNDICFDWMVRQSGASCMQINYVVIIGYCKFTSCRRNFTLFSPKLQSQMARNRL